MTTAGRKDSKQLEKEFSKIRERIENLGRGAIRGPVNPTAGQIDEGKQWMGENRMELAATGKEINKAENELKESDVHQRGRRTGTSPESGSKAKIEASKEGRDSQRSQEKDSGNGHLDKQNSSAILTSQAILQPTRVADSEDLEYPVPREGRPRGFYRNMIK